MVVTVGEAPWGAVGGDLEPSPLLGQLWSWLLQ